MMYNEMPFSNLKLLYINEYIDSILKRNSISDIKNGKYSLVISLYYYYEELNISQKQAYDLIYHIAKGDEKMQEMIRKRGGIKNEQL